MSKTYYNQSLSTLSFYKSHPYMLPFVGDDYESPKHKKLLLIGKSHYMPEGSIVHHDANSWYGNPVLMGDEQDWCITRGTREGKSGHFGKDINRCLNLVQPSGGNGWHQVAFLNYFLRSADDCQSISDLWNSYGGKDVDCEQSIRNFIKVLDILKPDLFVFLSSTVCKQAEGFDFRSILVEIFGIGQNPLELKITSIRIIRLVLIGTRPCQNMIKLVA